MKKVGYFSRTRYWQVYAFNNPPEGYKYRRAIDVPFKKFRFNHPFLTQTKFVIPYQNFDLFHSYNGIVAGRKPWVVEVETKVPRYNEFSEGNKYFDWGIDKLRSENCIGIIFTSEYTKKLNESNFKEWGIDPGKCRVIYRAIEPYNAFERSNEGEKFTILFVGNFFWLKGGYELLMAFKEFSQKHKDTRLIIISSFQKSWKDIPSEEDEKFVRKEITNNKNIEVLENIPHNEVLEIMRKSDIYVNTTYHDTFNNSILEGLSCGLPAITTNIRAIPEFVIDNWNGYTIDPNKNSRIEISDFILKKLFAYYSDSELLKNHSLNGRQLINEKFLIADRNKELSELYDQI